VREIVPSADIAHDPARTTVLPVAPVDLSGLRVGTRSFDAFLGDTDTDAIVILHRGRLVFERYANGMAAHTPHILMSVSKSMLGLLVGILAARGVLDPDGLVTAAVPEVRDTAYAGATIRNLLDMRVGLAFDEDYTATSGTIIQYRKATNWNPLQPGETPTDLRSFYAALRERDGAHGGALPLRLAEHRPARLGGRARGGGTRRRPDERADLAADGRRAQCLRHGRPSGRAALRRRRLHHRARPRAGSASCWSRPGGG